MELLQLKYFRYAAKKENISHTAHKFMVPPSSVSSAIKKLENELGVQLFDRTANSLKLNEYGRIFLRAVDAADAELKKAKIEMLNLSTQPTGEIKLLILSNRSIVTDAITRFRTEYPNISFNIKHEDYSGYTSFSEYDLIVYDGHINPSDMFEKRSFVHEEIFLAVERNNLLSSSGTVSLRNLTDEKFICMPKGSSIRNFMDKACSASDFEPDIAIECDDPHYIQKYLKMGLGVTFFPSISWKRQIDETIKLIRINDGLYRDSYMFINKNSSNIVSLFADILELT